MSIQWFPGTEQSFASKIQNIYFSHSNNSSQIRESFYDKNLLAANFITMLSLVRGLIILTEHGALDEILLEQFGIATQNFNHVTVRSIIFCSSVRSCVTQLCMQHQRVRVH